MNKKINYLLISLLGTLSTFAYLTYHHYSLILGLSSSSLCHISQKLNCDAAALSSYSEFLGLPISVIGLSFSAVMLLLFIFIKFGWLETTKLIEQSIKYLFLSAVVISVVLGLVSVFKLGVVCPFCLLSYLFEIVNFALVTKIFNTYGFSLPNWSELSGHNGYIASLLFVPFLSWFIASTIQSSFGYDQLKELIPEKIAQWQTMPVQKFDTELGLKKGDLTSNITLVEFADFKCTHCKAAAETIKNFTKGQPKIKIIFKPFPLDGNCNSNITMKGDNSRCQMAALVLCADKIAQKGWELHDYFFENQENLSQIADVKPSFKEFSDKLKLNFDEIVKCSESSEIYDGLRKMSEEAKIAEVEGTPTIYLNNKKLNYGQFLQVLKVAYELTQSSN